jgi:parallel beta-helix repeat protein
MVLIGILLVAIKAGKAAPADEAIYIRADGSVEPLGSPISSSDNTTYTISADLDQEIVVERDGIVLCGANHAIKGTGSGTGLRLLNRRNITIRNLKILDFSVGVLVRNSTEVALMNTTLRNNYFGTTIWNSSHGARLVENEISDSHNAIWIRESENATILRSTIRSSIWDGIYLSNSRNCTVEDNEIYASGHNGIRLDTSSSAVVSGNLVYSNLYYGVWINTSDNCTILRNLIWENNLGLRLDGSSNISIYQNSFLNNSMQAFSIESSGTWDNGLEGNYFSDYSGVDSNQDGVGDSPRIIYSNNLDRYPLMGSFRSFQAPPLHNINIVTNSSVEELEYSELSRTIRLRVSARLGQDQGFCRVSIPHALMDVNNISVLINGGATEVLHFNDNVYDDGVSRWIYFSYRHSTLEIVILPELSTPMMFTVLLATSLTLAALKSYKRARKDFIGTQ